jgi:hypothetical protein
MRDTLKFFLIPALIFLSGCTIAGVEIGTPKMLGGSDFSSMYQAHIEEQIDSLRDLGKEMGYMESYKASGMMSLMVDIPSIMSGAISTSYDAKVAGQGLDMIFSNLSARYETFLASGSLIAKEIAMITSGGDAYFRYDGLVESGLMDEGVRAIFEKYKNTWLALSQSDMDASLSGSIEQEIIASKLSQAISRMSLADIEKYLTKYPILKEQKDLGMSGSLHSYEVILANENIMNMFSAFIAEATEKDMSPEDKKGLEKSLKDISLSGIISFDASDAKRMIFDGKVRSGESEDMIVRVDESLDSTLLSLGSSGSAINISNKKTPDGYDFSLSMIQESEEAARIDGKIKKDGKRISMINMTLSAPAQ